MFKGLLVVNEVVTVDVDLYVRDTFD